MANNRMYLLHRPSGKAVYLGKRLGWGWYNVPDDLTMRVNELFRLVEEGEVDGSQDDFCIALETTKEGATLAEGNWRSINHGIVINGVTSLKVLSPDNQIDKKKIQVTTITKDDGLIIQEAEVKIGDDTYEHIQSRYLDTQEKQVRNSLIALGWTPPKKED
jgi:hypothetical protein